MKYDIDQVRAEFPILHQQVHDNPLVYLDNAATTQKPQCVIDAMSHFYEHDNANVHRAVHTLSERATFAYENARKQAKGFIHAASEAEIIFTKGTTDGINLLASSFGRQFLNNGDEIILSEMEHHSNIVPWQLIAELTGAVLRVIPVNDIGELNFDEYLKLLTPKTRIVSVVYVSNTLGTINDVKAIINAAHQHNIPVHLDAAQAAKHLPIDVIKLDCDFLTLSSHKMYGPTGVGILYGKSKWLEAMPPYQGGGDMITSVSFTKTNYNKLPYKFEAGTPNIAGVIGFGAAIEFIHRIGIKDMADHEDGLVQYALVRLKEINGLRIIGNPRERASAISFVMEGLHPYDIAHILNLDGIAVRTGHHCCQPLMDRFGVSATVRASFASYNTREEVDSLVQSLDKAKRMLQ